MTHREIVDKIDKTIDEYKDMRDSQNVIKCDESSNDICNSFDQILDRLLDLRICFVLTPEVDNDFKKTE